MICKNLMRPSLKDEWGIKELQNCLLNIMQYIHEFCEKNSIDYFIMGGSALGAIRHKGFIPWDDDMDIFMTPENYYRFRSAFEQSGDKTNFYLQEMGESKGRITQAKIRLNNSEFVESSVESWDIHHGIFIDIMIMHNYPNRRLSRIWQRFWNSYLEIKQLSLRNYDRRGVVVKLVLKLLRITPKRFLFNYAISQVWKYNNVPSDNFFHLYLSQPIRKSVYPKRLFESYRLVDFEQIKLRVPICVEEYLSILFGEYMKIPDLAEIKYHQHVSKWNIDIPFTLRKNGRFSDEKYYW